MKYFFKIFIIIVLFNALFFVSFGGEPSVSAQSAVVIDIESGRILYQKNMNLKLPMASTTKVLTALVAIENGKLENPVKINKTATNIEGSSIYLKEGEIIKLKDLLYGLMLCSGNDAACAIAEHIGGNIVNFVKMMNKKAADIGAVNSHFTNPHGLHNADHYTTAYDLALISRKAMLNSNFKKIVGTKLWVAEREGNGYKYFYNKNKVLTQYNGGTGIKIGYTKKSGRCLVASGKRGDMEVICVVLNAPDWFNDSYRLMDFVFSKYKPIKIIDQNQIFKSINIKNGVKDETKIIAGKEVILPLSDAEKDEVYISYSLEDKLTAPVRRKQKVGTAQIFLNNEKIFDVDIITREDIDYERDSVIKTIRKWM